MAIDVIKYDGDGNTVAFKYPDEDFTTFSQLVVQQAQTAVFYYKGAIADVFDKPGTYTLKPANIPLLRKLVNLPFGGDSPFHATVYFFDKTERLNEVWGASNIPFLIKEFDLPLMVGISGEYSFKLGNIDSFVSKVLGNLPSYSSEEINQFSLKFIRQKATQYLTDYFANNNIDLFTIETELVNISSTLFEPIRKDLEEYGINLTKFVAMNVAKNENSEGYRRYYNLRTKKLNLREIDVDIEMKKAVQQGNIDLQQYENILKTNAAVAEINIESIRIRELAKANEEANRLHNQNEYEAIQLQTSAEVERLNKLGMSGAQAAAFKVAEYAAQNTGTGNFTSAGIGLGTMVGTAGVVGGMYQDALSQIGNPLSSKPDETTSLGMDSFSINDTGSDILAEDPIKTPLNEKNDLKTKLLELKESYDFGLLSEEEYQIYRKEILTNFKS